MPAINDDLPTASANLGRHSRFLDNALELGPRKKA
jgi:hypothetical protein